MKKNNLLSRLSLLVVTVMLLISCGKKVEYAQVIPADATVLFSLDIKSLVQKSGLDKDKQLQGKLTNALKQGLNAESMQFVEKVIENPAEAGISINEKMYVFETKNESSGFVARVANKGKLKKVIDLLEGQGMEVTHNQITIDGYELATIDRKTFCCYNDDVVLVLISPTEMYADEVMHEVKELTAQTTEKSMAATNGFTRMNSKKGDIAALVSMAVIPGEYREMMKMSIPEGVSLEEIFVLCTLSFENGKMVVTGENYSDNEQVKKLNAESAKIMSKMNSGFLDYFPENCLYYQGFNIDGKKLIEIMSSNKQIQGVLAPIIQEGIDLNKIFSSMNGDVAFGVNGFSMQNNIPSLAIYVDVVDNEYINMLNALVGNTATKIDEDAYSFDAGAGVIIHYGIKDKVFYITTDGADRIAQKQDKSLSKITPNAKGAVLYFLLNTKEIVQLPVLGMMRSGEYGEFINALGMFDKLEVVATTPEEVILNVVMTNQKENALAQLIAIGLSLDQN